MPGIQDGLSIGQVAARVGLSVHALRYYEREGILATAVRRDGGGRRVYSPDDVEWLRICIILRASGMPISAIREYTKLVQLGSGNEEERLALLRRHERRVLDQIDQLTGCLDQIRFKIGIYEDHMEQVRAARGAGGDGVVQPSEDGCEGDGRPISASLPARPAVLPA